MARQPRLSLAGYPHHIIQRGNNRQNIFLTDEDRKAYLAWIAEYAAKFDIKIHAYVLMDNHTHLVLTPKSEQSLASLMQSLGQRYTQNFNYFHQHSGTVWEGRYKSTVIQSDRYLLACMVYVDLNPVRAGIVSDPADYAWSSHRHYIGQQFQPLVTAHEMMWNLGNTPFSREKAYLELVRAGLSQDQYKQVTDSALKGWALGDTQFTGQIQASTQRRVQKQTAGRPKRGGTPSI
jgi:putative transposase